MTAGASLPAHFGSALSALRISTDPATCAQYAVDEITPSAVTKPTTAEEVAEIVRFAALEKLALIPCGNRTKLHIGMPPSRYDIALDMTGLHQIAHYDPGDLTISVGAGIPLSELNSVLFDHRQFLPLLVPWYSRSSVGGVIVSGMDSPLRHFYGSARDFLIGAEFVDGSGRLCKSGGRVVKNVTGYDLHKLLIGSLGTLGVITRLNFRTFPTPPASRGFVASFPTAEGALALRRKIAESPLTPLTLDVLNPGLAHIFASSTPSTPEVALFAGEYYTTKQIFLAPIGKWFRPAEWQLCAAFGGALEVLDRYGRDLVGLAEEWQASSTFVLDDSTRPSLWGRLRESTSMLLEAYPAAAILKLNGLPSQHASLFASLRQITDRFAVAHASVARASGAIYFALLPSLADPNSLQLLRQAVSSIFSLCAKESVSATLLWCPAALKRYVNIWGPPRPDFRLMQRLKSAFDPQNLFAPGRFPAS